MAAQSPLARTPFFFLSPRVYRETEVAAFIHREHHRGRALADILHDPYVARCGGESIVRAVLRRPSLIRALRRDVADAIRLQGSELREGRVSGPPRHTRAPGSGTPR